MEILHIHPDREPLTREKPSCVALGTFDGVHIGHQKVIGTAIHRAKEKGMESGVMTFHPHPKEVLGKVSHASYLTSLDEKLHQLEQLGVDFVMLVAFTPAFALLRPQTFIQKYIIDQNIKHVVCGFDFCFGHKGEGNKDTLIAWSEEKQDFSVDVVSSIDEENEKISSSRIRAILSEGDISDIPRLLGRRYTIQGKVIHGEKRGRQIGFPTANIEPDTRYVLPRLGVYVVYLHYKGHVYPGVLNLGTRPTFHQDGMPSIEVHVLDKQLELYGEVVSIEWLDFIRPELKFESVDDLIAQINQDVEVARQKLNDINRTTGT